MYTLYYFEIVHDPSFVLSDTALLVLCRENHLSPKDVDAFCGLRYRKPECIRSVVLFYEPTERKA